MFTGTIMGRIPQSAQIQPQRIGHHTEGGEAHGRRTEHGIELPAQKGDKYACRQGDANAVVEKCPEQILMDIPQGGTAEANGCRHIRQAAFHQHHICCINGHIRTGTNGNADIRTGEGGGIVDAIPHHGHGAIFHKLANDRFLPIRQDPGNHLIDPGLGTNGVGCTGIVASEHDHLNPHLPEIMDGLGTVWLDNIRHGDDTHQLATPCKEQRRFALLCQVLCLLQQGCGDGHPPPHILHTAAQKGDPIQGSGETVAWKGSEVLHLWGLFARFLHSGHNGSGKGMLAGGLQRTCQGQQCLLCEAGGREKLCYSGLAAGDGAGFIQGNNLHLSGLFQRDGGFEQDAVFGTHPIAHHNRHRGRQTQGAGAGNHQNRNASGQGKAELHATSQPDHRGHHGDGDHSRYKDPCHTVCNLGNGRLGCRRIADHFDNLRKGRILPHSGGTATDVPLLIGGGGRNGIPLCLVHRDTLAGEGGFIHCSVTVNNHTVHRDILARAHHKDIAALQLRDGNFMLFPLLPENGSLGGQLHQPLQGIGGLALGAGLQQLAHGDEGENHGGRFKIELLHVGLCKGSLPTHDGIAHKEQGHHTPGKGGKGTQCHKGIHIGGTMEEPTGAADKEPLVNHHHCGCQQQLHQPHGHMIALKPPRNGQPQHHMPHGEVHQYQQKAQGGEEAAFQHGCFPIKQGILPGRGSGCLPGCPLQGSAIACRSDSGNDNLRGGCALHPHGVGQQTDRAAGDTRHLGDRLFHPGRAGGTAHTRYNILFHSAPYFIKRCKITRSSSTTSSLPSRISSTTQERIWLPKSSLLKALRAAETAVDCMRMSMQ